jgi:hypothetical protein
LTERRFSRSAALLSSRSASASLPFSLQCTAKAAGSWQRGVFVKPQQAAPDSKERDLSERETQARIQPTAHCCKAATAALRVG